MFALALMVFAELSPSRAAVVQCVLWCIYSVHRFVLSDHRTLRHVHVSLSSGLSLFVDSYSFTVSLIFIEINEKKSLSQTIKETISINNIQKQTAVRLEASPSLRNYMQESSINTCFHSLE